MFADGQVVKGHHLDGVQLGVVLLELGRLLVFLGVVVGAVAEVEVAIDLLVQVASFLQVVWLLLGISFEEACGSRFEPQHVCKLLGHGQLVEVRWMH